MKRFALILFALTIAACSAAPAPRTTPTNLHLDDGGHGGVPVVFIHGNGGNTTVWQSQLAHLRQTRRAIAIDLPGFGQSPAPANGDYSLDAMSRAIEDATQSLGLKRFVIAGHSYGGAVVAHYVAQHPDRVAGVIYVDSAGGGITLTPEQRQQFLDALHRDRKSVVRAWFKPMLAPSSDAVREQVFASTDATRDDAFIGALTSLEGYDMKADVGAYHGPVLAIAATDIESPMSFHKQFPDVAATKVAKAGHWVMLDQPDAVNAAIDDFLKRIS